MKRLKVFVIGLLLFILNLAGQFNTEQVALKLHAFDKSYSYTQPLFFVVDTTIQLEVKNNNQLLIAKK